MGNLEETLQQEIELPEGNLPPLTFTSNFSQDEFEAIVRHAMKRIVEVDLFHVVPSQRLSAAFTSAPF